MITIQVFRKSTGKPVKGVKVSVQFEGLTRGFSSAEYTNERGEVHISNSPGNGTIYVNGNSAYRGRIEGRQVVYV